MTIDSYFGRKLNTDLFLINHNLTLASNSKYYKFHNYKKTEEIFTLAEDLREKTLIYINELNEEYKKDHKIRSNNETSKYACDLCYKYSDSHNYSIDSKKNIRYYDQHINTKTHQKNYQNYLDENKAKFELEKDNQKMADIEKEMIELKK